MSRRYHQNLLGVIFHSCHMNSSCLMHLVKYEIPLVFKTWLLLS